MSQQKVVRKLTKTGIPSFHLAENKNAEKTANWFSSFTTRNNISNATKKTLNDKNKNNFFR